MEKVLLEIEIREEEILAEEMVVAVVVEEDLETATVAIGEAVVDLMVDIAGRALPVNL